MYQHALTLQRLQPPRHTNMIPTSTTPSMKLLIDTKSQRVLFVVDFLFSLLTMPAGDHGCSVGSIGNLYSSAKKFDAAPADVNAAVQCSGRPVVPDAAAMARCVVQRLVGCQGVCQAVTAPSAPAGSWSAHGALVTYTGMDDLKVVPMSTISGIARLSTLGVKDIGALQEKTVQLGYAEGMIIKASMQSKTVLTDVFVGKKKLLKYMAPSKRCVAKIFGAIFLLQFMCVLAGLIVDGIKFNQSRMY